jgi:hypothetical protein
MITPEVTPIATRRPVAFLPDRHSAPLALAECRRLGRHARVGAGERRAAP